MTKQDMIPIINIVISTLTTPDITASCHPIAFINPIHPLAINYRKRDFWMFIILAIFPPGTVVFP